MNKSKLKSYAPQARKDFIAAVAARAHLLGLSEAGDKLEVAPGERKGDIAIIAGREWPVKLYEQRERLIKHMKTVGFSQTVEAVSYTWFNRFAALRYMEIHDYLDHGHRVLSNREGGMPEILNYATELDLPGLNKDKAIELKLAGNMDGDLYKMLLVAQCNALSNSMPFLFEHIDDETELLLPDNLLRTDSVIAKLVEAIPEEDWQEVEIIGWLYQFYISEKKDEVIGKVVKSEDIPAATQLFTPNWIVQYLVQNSVGRLWLMANPASTLKSQWPYYIEPAEQTPEVQTQLDALIQTRMNEDGGSLNPETITMLDPACGSGHILVVGYDVFKAIYLERGYQLRAIPRLILEKNLYGLDIDDRAAQMAGFALLMKARADDRRLFDNPPKLNVLALQESKGLNGDEIVQSLQSAIAGQVDLQGVTPQTRAEFADNDLFPNSRPQMNLGESVVAESLESQSIRLLIDTFAHAKTFGSLIQIPPELNAQMATLAERLQQIILKGDLYAQAAAQDLLPLVAQAQVLGMQFDTVVANPPYMGSRFMNPELKLIAREYYRAPKGDFFAAALIRFNKLIKTTGNVGYMTPTTWLYLETYDDLRRRFLTENAMVSLVVPQYHTFFESAAVPICAFVMQGQCVPRFRADFFGLEQFRGAELQPGKFLEAIEHSDCGWRYQVALEEFAALPGAVLAFELPPAFRAAFRDSLPLSTALDLRQGMATTDNDRFLRRWHEVSWSRIAMGYLSARAANEVGKDWFPYNKGGSFRKWFGNNEYIVLYQNDGQELLNLVQSKYPKVSDPEFVIKNRKYYLRPAITWSALTIASLSLRMNGPGFIFDTKGQSGFAETEESLYMTMSFLNSRVASTAASAIAPTMDYNSGTIAKLPYRAIGGEKVEMISRNAHRARAIAKNDWDLYQTSWDFQSFPTLAASSHSTLESSYTTWNTLNREIITEMKRLEEENNRLFIEVYGLADELNPDVPIEQITLAVNPAYRYSGKLTVEEQCTRFLQDTMQELISYAISCMMGRYSLDEPGLIYAHAGNIDFDATRYTTFPADADGIVPLTDELWFEDDAANRIREFLRSVWGAETLEENLTWLAESLGKKGNETPDETIRRYLSGSFFKDHLQTYKKRPIYWLFSSGKQGAFQALVYLHRYHEGTLARMRSEYVVPLTGKIQSRIEMLTKDAEAATSTAARNKLNKEIEGLRKKHVELLTYDEKLRHYADMRIKLDLDDGVKVNYGKFGDLLAEVKAVTGGSSDE